MTQQPEDPLGHVRRRPGMYFGSTDSSGLRALLMEVLGNSLDEVLAGRADTIDVTMHTDDSVTISDNGTGMGARDERGTAQFVQQMFTSFHLTPTADEHEPHVHLACGTGLGPVCALCERVEVSVVHGGVVTNAMFSRGVPVGSTERDDGSLPSGTTVRLWPDPEIFVPVRWSVGQIEAELTPLPHLVPGLSIHFVVEPRTYGPVADLTDLFDEVRGWKPLSHDSSLLISADHGANRVRLAVGWHDNEWPPTIRSYCNLIPTNEGGSHVQGIEEGLRRVFGGGPADGLTAGMVAVLHVMLLEPNFAGPTKGRLDSPQAIEMVAEAIADQLPSQLEDRPGLLAMLQLRQRPDDGRAAPDHG